MLTKIDTLVATLALFLCLPQHFIRAEIAAAVLPLNNETTISQSSEQPNGGQVVQCSEYFQEIVAGIYGNNITNFNRVIQFSEFSSSPNFKADILSALFEVMQRISYIQNPLDAILLYNEVEALINSQKPNLHTYQLEQLEYIRFYLFWSSIVPKGADILEAAVYLNTCNQENTTVSHLLDLLYASNETLTVVTIAEMVNNVRWVLPLQQLLPILSNISIHVSQNVEAMLALYYEPQFQDALQIQYFVKLIQLQEHPDYNTTVSSEKQNRVNAIFPRPLQTLLGGVVCLNQEMSNGSRFYLQECAQSYRACVFIYPELQYAAKLQVEVNQATSGFIFRSVYFNNRELVILAGEPEQPDGYKLNVWSPHSTEDEDVEWKVQLSGDQVVLQNMNSTMTLCAGNSLARQNGEWFAYTRSLMNDECKWFVDDCNDVTNS